MKSYILIYVILLVDKVEPALLISLFYYIQFIKHHLGTNVSKIRDYAKLLSLGLWKPQIQEFLHKEYKCNENFVESIYQLNFIK